MRLVKCYCKVIKGSLLGCWKTVQYKFCYFLDDTFPKCMHCLHRSCPKDSTLRVSKGNVFKCIFKFMLRPSFPEIIIITPGNETHIRGYQVFAMDITVFQIIIIDITAPMRALDSTGVNTIPTTQHIAFLHILNDKQHTCDNVDTDSTLGTNWQMNTTQLW